MAHNSTVFDTNVWVATMNSADSLHEQAVQELERVARPVILPEYVLVETCSVLALRAGKNVADKFVHYALDNAEIELMYSSEAMTRKSAAFFLSHPHRGLSFVDVFLLLLSQSYDVITYDKQLQKSINRTQKI